MTRHSKILLRTWTSYEAFEMHPTQNKLLWELVHSLLSSVEISRGDLELFQEGTESSYNTNPAHLADPIKTF
jgi:hypothetical protein